MNNKLKNLIARTLVICTLTFAGGAALSSMNMIQAFASTYETTDSINLRSSMDVSEEPITEIPKGTAFNITWTSEDGAWAEVEYNGRTGYILTMYLTSSNKSVDENSSNSSDSSDSSEESSNTSSSSDEEKSYSNTTGTLPLIVIDAGHGGDDPGAVASYNGVSYEEADYALAIAQYLEVELSNLGYDVLMTRNGDDSITMKERVALANSHNAALFFSMHHNAADASVDGALTIYPSVKTNGDSISLDESKKLSYMISEAYVGTGMDYNGIYKDSDISGYPLYVLSETEMVSVLTEMGFITNAGDAALISDPSFQKELARNLAHQIDNYFMQASN